MLARQPAETAVATVVAVVIAAAAAAAAEMALWLGPIGFDMEVTPALAGDSKAGRFACGGCVGHVCVSQEWVCGRARMACVAVGCTK